MVSIFCSTSSSSSHAIVHDNTILYVNGSAAPINRECIRIPLYIIVLVFVFLFIFLIILIYFCCYRRRQAKLAQLPIVHNQEKINVYDYC
jgi:hypothetical protein